MPSLYAQYCYSDTTEASNAEISSPAVVGSTVIVSAKSYDNVTFNMTYQVTPLNGSAPYLLLNSRPYISCPSVGPVITNSGVSLADSIMVSWLVVLVWAVAYYLKSLRTGVRGY